MRFCLLLMLAAILNFVNGRALHERIRRVARSDYNPSLDKTPSDHDYYISDDDGEYIYGDYEDYDEFEMFTCFAGDEEVAITVMCDGYADCPDGSDEVANNCEEHGVTTVTTTTTATTTTTTTTTTATTTETPQTVKPSVREPEDYDYEDACTEKEFQCASDPSICLPRSQVCDGIHDCPEKEDEVNCTATYFDMDYLDVIMPPIATPSSKKLYDYDGTNKFDIGKPSSSKDLKISHSRPPIVIMMPPIKHDIPVFVPGNVPNFEEKDLALESDYQYIPIKLVDQDKINEKFMDDLSNVKYVGRPHSENQLEQSTTAGVPFDSDGEIEINHDTGELTLLENGQKIALSAEASSNDDESISSLQLKSDNSDATRQPNVELNKSKKKIEKQGKKLRGIVSQLLHHVGKIVDSGGSLDSNDLIHTDIDINIGTGTDLSVDSLYSRILSGASRPRLRINVSLQL